MERIFYVYVYFRPDNGSPCYIGKGKNKRAFSNHDDSPRFRELAESVKGEFPVVIIRDNLTEDEAHEFEVLLISILGRLNIDPGGILVNVMGGGPHPPSQAGAKLSPQHKEKFSFRGRKHTAASRQKISLVQGGRVFSEEAKENMRKAKLGTKQAPDHVSNRMRWAPDSQWITDGTINKRVPKSEQIPEGWKIGRTWSGIWITNGVKNSRLNSNEPLPEGWSVGRTINARESKMGGRWITNGEINARITDTEPPEGWRFGITSPHYHQKKGHRAHANAETQS